MESRERVRERCPIVVNRERVLEAVKKRWDALKGVDEIWRSDREVVLTAVQHDGNAAQFAAEALKADREVVLAA
eukprot:1335581-Amphidinium_carterae.1